MIQRNLDVHDDISKAIYSVISYDKCGMSFEIIKLHEKKSYHVSPHVASNLSNQNRIHVASNLSDRVSRA